MVFTIQKLNDINNNMKKPKISKEYLIDEYINKNKTAKEIANDLNRSKNYIVYRIKYFGIKKQELGLKIKKPKRIKIKKKYGYLKTIKNIDDIFYEFLCTKCNKTCIKRIGNVIRSNKMGFNTSCGCYLQDMKNHHSWRGYGDLSLTFFHNIERRAKESKLDFEIDIKFCWELYQKQNGKCALSGIPIVFTDKAKTQRKNTASLDRIDNTKGYTKNNIWWVHKDINFMKRILKLDDFIYYCKEVAKYNDN